MKFLIDECLSPELALQEVGAVEPLNEVLLIAIHGDVVEIDRFRLPGKSLDLTMARPSKLRCLAPIAEMLEEIRCRASRGTAPRGLSAPVNRRKGRRAD